MISSLYQVLMLDIVILLRIAVLKLEDLWFAKSWQQHRIENTQSDWHWQEHIYTVWPLTWELLATKKYEVTDLSFLTDTPSPKHVQFVLFFCRFLFTFSTKRADQAPIAAELALTPKKVILPLILSHGTYLTHFLASLVYKQPSLKDKAISSN